METSRRDGDGAVFCTRLTSWTRPRPRRRTEYSSWDKEKVALHLSSEQRRQRPRGLVSYQGISRRQEEQVASFLRSYFGPIIKLENSPRLWSSKSKMSVPTHGCCRAILYFTNPNKILPSKKERDNDWGLDDHDLRAIL